ncbi:MAG: aldose 1-epimerase [Deltaproteobacteria bacterium]|nr:aldose 1-epimerase [Nannocystaceae bacterium]
MALQLTLTTDRAQVRVVPHLGGGLSAFDWLAGDTPTPIFRAWNGVNDPSTLACIPMLPWWARLSRGGFAWRGRFHPVPLTDPGDSHPLHGDGWRSPWRVVARDDHRVLLGLRSQAIAPFDYEAELEYGLVDATLSVRLSLCNRASEPLPHGLGLHPWLPRTDDVTLHAVADGTWLEQPPALPRTLEADAIPTDWNFSQPRRLPARFVDNCFTGWDGRAVVAWPSRGCQLEIAADPATLRYHVYAPGPERPIFCFEQVSHVIDALNLAASPEQSGLRVLEPGESTEMTVRYHASAIESPAP